MKHYDVIIIGTGAANIVADAALRENKTVALIERGRFGGTCLNRGCIPTKMLVTAANAICEIREARRIGVNAENVTLDWKLLSERLWKRSMKVKPSAGTTTASRRWIRITVRRPFPVKRK